MTVSLFILLNAFFVSFLDKPEKATPALSPRAIEQRQKWDIPTDEMDYPVCSLYLDSLRAMGAMVYHTSRWMNGATVEMSDSLAAEIAKLKFVIDVEMTRNNTPSNLGYLSRRKRQIETIEPTYVNRTDRQLAVYNLHPLIQSGYEGQGILMAICDGGFNNADQLDCFRQSELELGHFDFTDDGDDFYGSTGNHGTMCLSAISGIDYLYNGAAPQAQYYLMRSEEYATESPKEMDNLVAALEKADSLGVNVFSVSLGYAQFDNNNWNLSHDDLDGKTTRASRAATIAARKGMLVCAAAGNDGDNNWRKISVPADADSILTVGAVRTDSTIGTFSSYGPSADGRVKPEVCAVGVRTVLILPDGNITNSNGTSFATPLIAGMAATLWSALPNENAMQIRERIIRSADRYNYTNDPERDHYGYGIPDAWKAYMGEGEGTKNTFTEPEDQPHKVIHGEQILIFRHGHVYNLAGQRVM